jgi:2-polyprenyl-3-methyl-5-hydroxy-6-metoxy-1,4-benzoquinol methylase
MTLDYDIMLANHRGEITPAAAFTLQTERDAGNSMLEPIHPIRQKTPQLHIDGMPAPSPRPIVTAKPCLGKAILDQYEAASAWIDANGDDALKLKLQLHRDTVEPRRATEEGGDGTLGACVVARRRADVVQWAKGAGHGPRPVESPANGPAGHAVRYVDPAALAIRDSAPTSSHAYIVGKGPSLDRLTAADFTNELSPVLACNEAVQTIEKLSLPNPLFGVQQDARVGVDGCPKNGTWLLGSQSWVACKGKNHPNAIRYDCNKIGGHSKSLTADQCMRLLGSVGFKTATMLAFDACTSGEVDYAKSIGKSPVQFGQNPGRFKGYCIEISRCAMQNGLSLTWKSPYDWIVICVLKGGGKYGKDHAYWLRDQVSHRIATPHSFRILTDSQDLGPTAVGLSHGWPGWWSKLEMFRPGQLHGCILYLDLDVVLCRNIVLPDPKTIEEGFLYARPDWGRTGEINSSVMMFRAGTCRPVYDRMVAAPQQTMHEFSAHGDQHFTSTVMAGKIKPLPLIVNSYKLSKADPAVTDIMAFHGQPKPWDVDVDWIPVLARDHTSQTTMPSTMPQNRFRKSGVWNHEDLTDLAKMVVSIPGDFAEVGVFQGNAFRRLAELARDQKRLVHAYDSFIGMATPGEHDGTKYPKGRFDIGGPDAFRTLMRNHGLLDDSYAVHAGYIPECLNTEPQPTTIALAIVDLDHYAPTVAAIQWVWPRLAVGGIMALDDYFPGRIELASLAIDQWLNASGDVDILYLNNAQLIVRKRDRTTRFYTDQTQRTGNPHVLVSPGMTSMQKVTQGGILAVETVVTLGLSKDSMARKTLLDFGCGTGRVSRVLCGMFREILGYDTNVPAIALARTECPPVDRMVFSNLRYTNTLDEEGMYDVAISHNVFEHLNETDCLKAWSLLCCHVVPDGIILANIHIEDNRILAVHLGLTGTGLVWYHGPPIQLGKL